MPPFVGPAVKVMLVPAQMVVAVELAVTDVVTTEFTVTLVEEIVPLPQVLVGVTVTVPLVVPMVTVMLLVPEPAVMLAPDGTVHV